ncbi:hypothetical protein BXZ70DRAFT_899246 [Cristinia sonorae]|uniref:Uncharacterized protein n=1 Tax=Cristinia sonorae TaxID=1940300 RepID=A0A8K0UHF7_9AGAR|nr:hypothetical protein BXZ70DRAFT_899246 [Cristinia sonorae]
MAYVFPIDIAQIVALFLESIFYGIYLVTFGLCLYILLFSAHTRHRHRLLNPFLLIAIAMFTIATLDVALLLRHILDAFIYYKGPGGAQAEFADISYWVNVTKTVTYCLQTSIADGLLIYRCFIVYGRSLVVLITLCILWTACLSCEISTVYIEFTLRANAFLNSKRLSPFIISVLVMTLALNVTATAMIIYKIYSIQRATKRYLSSDGSGSESTLGRAMRIVIESVAIYTVSVITFVAVYLAGNNAQYGVSDCVVQIIGITFNLMIIRLDQGRAIESRHRPSDRRDPGPTSSTSGLSSIMFEPKADSTMEFWSDVASVTMRTPTSEASTTNLSSQNMEIEWDERREQDLQV